MKVFISQYALSKGIFEVEGETREKWPDDFQAIGYYYDFRKPHWHETKQEAIEKAEEMRLKKIASLKKQIAKLEKMRFE